MDVPDSGQQLTGAAFAEIAMATMRRVSDSQAASVTAAAGLIVRAVRRGGVLQAFGTGHSEVVSMEIAGRAGGLVPTNRIALRDLVLLGGADPTVLVDPLLERDPSVAGRLYTLANVAEADCFILTSNSGVNGAVVELARLVKRRGHDLIAVTSLAHTAAATPRHSSGQRLVDLADVVLDNGAPFGDAVLASPGGDAVGPVSSITGALLAQQMVVTAVGMLVDAGAHPPVYRSTNVPGGEEHNRSVEARYGGRIRRTA